jgi:WhiB family redox-sensing transcriptional regulator
MCSCHQYNRIENLYNDDMSDSPSFIERAACRDEDPEMFYSRDAATQKLARMVCDSCEVRVDCLMYALQTNQPDGIWGGTTEQQRRELHSVDSEV